MQLIMMTQIVILIAEPLQKKKNILWQYYGTVMYQMVKRFKCTIVLNDVLYLL